MAVVGNFCACGGGVYFVFIFTLFPNEFYFVAFFELGEVVERV